MPAVNVSPFGPKPQFVDWITGAFANGYKVFFYVAGSVNTKQATYTDSTGSVANTNPLVLDTAGQPNNVQLWMLQGAKYKVLIATPTDSDPPTNGFVLGDQLTGINDTSFSAVSSQWLAGPNPSFVSATQFALGGDQTSNFEVNRRVQTINSGGTVYGTITASVFAAGITTITIVPDSGTLDAGLSAVNYGIISFNNTSDPRPQANIQVFTASGIWTKPAGNARLVEVICFGGGGSGGGGRGGAAASIRNGGSGGGGGAVNLFTFRATDLPATVAVTIPNANTGGNGGSTSNGSPGTSGGSTTFGTFLTANGGGGGIGGDNGGTTSGGGGGGSGSAGSNGISGAGASGGFPQQGAVNGFAAAFLHQVGGGGGGSFPLLTGGEAEFGGGGGGGGTGNGTQGGGGGNSLFGAAGGGSGGGLTAGNTESPGGKGGGVPFWNPGLSQGVAGGTVAGGAGQIGASSTIYGGGGGSGGGSFAGGTGGAGGAGGTPGGGGGAGGAGTTVGGAGGGGARGECRIYTYF